LTGAGVEGLTGAGVGGLTGKGVGGLNGDLVGDFVAVFVGGPGDIVVDFARERSDAEFSKYFKRATRDFIWSKTR
jgi:hypothetical protein